MHNYSLNIQGSGGGRRVSVPIVLAIISLAFAWFINHIAVMAQIESPWFISLPSVMPIYAFLLYIYSECLWKIKFLSKTPNLEGTWIGRSESTYAEKGQEGGTTFSFVVHIHQTWQLISIIMYTDESRSISNMAYLDTQNFKLKYEYSNEPFNTSKNTMRCHRGVQELFLLNNCKTLNGGYYTDKHRANYGEIKMQKCSNSIIDRDDLTDEQLNCIRPES